jgi:hypothetical protein
MATATQLVAIKGGAIAQRISRIAFDSLPLPLPLPPPQPHPLPHNFCYLATPPLALVLDCIRDSCFG